MASSDIHLLLVEDNEVDVLLLRDVLADIPSMAMTVAQVSGLREALEHLAAHRVDVVLLDLNLPDSYGLASFTELHRHHPAVPVLVLTGTVDETLGEAAVREGAQDFLNKGALQSRWLGRAIRYAIERQSTTAVLMQSRQQLRDLAARLLAIREDERTRIAREIHDELGQVLTTLKMDLRWIQRRIVKAPAAQESPELLTRLEEAQSTADGAIAMVQRLALDLRPGVLDTLGLADAIADELRRFRDRSGLQCDLDADPSLPDQPGPVATAFFRICQELLTNIARHAEATRVHIELSADDGRIAMIVTDNGIGLRSEQLSSRTSLGLLGIRERAAAFGGDVVFSRPAGGGTRVSVSMSLPADQRFESDAAHSHR